MDSGFPTQVRNRLSRFLSPRVFPGRAGRGGQRPPARRGSGLERPQQQPGQQEVRDNVHASHCNGKQIWSHGQPGLIAASFNC